MGRAAIDDVSAWCLLALVVSVAQSDTGIALWTLGLTAAFIATMFIVIRPMLVRIAGAMDRRPELPQRAITLVVIALLLSALATEWIGIHAIFGAFLVGAIIPHNSIISREIRHRLEDIVVVLFLPAFFAYTGLRTEIGLVNTPEAWAFCGLIILIACLGKFGGSAAAARFTGLSWRESSALGILMNTRGLMELIVLNIGLDLGVLSPTLFAILVIMAVVTTLMTSPILVRITRNSTVAQNVAENPAGS